MQTGKKTIRTAFKKDSDAGGMQNQIESSEREIESLGNFFDVLTIYLAERVIPQFKKEKLLAYQKMVQAFTIMEINNAHLGATFWNQAFQHPNIKQLRTWLSHYELRIIFNKYVSLKRK